MSIRLQNHKKYVQTIEIKISLIRPIVNIVILSLTIKCVKLYLVTHYFYLIKTFAQDRPFPGMLPDETHCTEDEYIRHMSAKTEKYSWHIVSIRCHNALYV